MPAPSKSTAAKKKPGASKRRASARKPRAAAAKTLVIVESPTKARTIGKFLKRDFVVKASVGHVRDLPTRATEVPAKYKKTSWGRLGVNVDENFEPIYVIPKEKQKLVREIKTAVKGAGRIYFATDEDREGESISWHLLQVLKPKVPYERLVFHEITRTAIRRALESPRPIDGHLVSAQETRRIVDRLFGYQISPLLWKKMAPRLSAGRVQSVAVRLLVERERARQQFHEAAFWRLNARFSKDDAEFGGQLVELAGRRIAVGKDFDPDTGALKAASGDRAAQPLALDGERARQVEQEVRSGPGIVASVERKPFRTAPQPPYVTSTLQQDANRRLRLSARETMRLAQLLYENGFITYMRTDSTSLSGEAKTAARRQIVESFGREYLNPKVRYYRNKVKNAQEAHEAIRPAGRQFRDPGEVRTQLSAAAGRLYEMIWRRTLASQMKNAVGTNTTVLVEVGEARFRVAGKTIEFEGHLKAGRPSAFDQRVLPQLEKGDPVNVVDVTGSERRTQPPQRYTEGSLIRELERRGIGRPSTWANIVDLVQNRSYAFKRDRTLIPTFTAMAVVGLLEKHFTRLADYEFTAKLEDQLDAIARGERDSQQYLKSFYYGNGFKGLEALVKAGDQSIDPREVCGLPVGEAEDGTLVEVRIGRYGPFLLSGDKRCGLPSDVAPDELDVAKATELLEIAARASQPLGQDPRTGRNVYVKQGRFGPYVQLGDRDDEGGPKRASLLKGMVPEDITAELALQLLSLPRELGQHPDSGTAVTAANGRFGPFVRCGEEVRSIPAGGSPLTIRLEEALDLLRKEKPKRRWGQPRQPIRKLGPHPETKADLRVLSGRYGPYVTDGDINASLPRGVKPAEVTMHQAVDLLRQRAERIASGAKPVRRRRARK